MIRLVYVFRRVPGMGLGEFHHHMRGVRAPLVASHCATLGIRRCVHSYSLDDPGRASARKSRSMLEPYDGVEEVWFNTLEEATAAFGSLEGKQAAMELVEDERRFVDFSRSSLWFAIELPQVNPSPENIVAREDGPIVKLHYPLRHLSELTFEAAQLYWRMNHGPLARSLAPATGIKRYMQVHRYPVPLADELRALRGSMEEPYTGHAEAWRDTVEDARSREQPERERAGARAYALALADEQKFIDWSRSTFFLTKECVVIDR